MKTRFLSLLPLTLVALLVALAPGALATAGIMLFLLIGAGQGGMQMASMNLVYEFGDDDQLGMRIAVVNALGATPDLAVDTLHISLSTGDKFLLCSDGLHEYFNDEEELGQVLDSLPGEAGVARLVEMANERGGKDNITALLVWVLSVPGPQISRDLKHDLNALKSSAFFEGLTLQEALQTLRVCVERELRAGEALPRITTGDDTAYLVLDGTIVTARGDSVGPGAVIHPQALVGGEEPEGLAHSPFPARVLAVRRNDFLRLCNEHRALGIKLLTSLCKILSRHTAGLSE